MSKQERKLRLGEWQWIQRELDGLGYILEMELMRRSEGLKVEDEESGIKADTLIFVLSSWHMVRSFTKMVEG